MDPVLLAIIAFSGDLALEFVPTLLKNDSVKKQLRVCFNTSLIEWCPNEITRNSKKNKILDGIQNILNNPEEINKNIKANADIQSFYKIYLKELARSRYQSAYNYIKNEIDRADFQVIKKQLNEFTEKQKDDFKKNTSILDARINELNESFKNHLYKEAIKISKTILSNHGEYLNPKLFYSIYLKRSKSFLNISLFGKTEYHIKRAFIALKQAERINTENNLNDKDYKLQLANAYINLSYVRSAELNLNEVKHLLDDRELRFHSEFTFIKGKYYLAKAENSGGIEKNSFKAIDELKAAIKKWRKDIDPYRNAVCKINLGKAYSLLSRAINRVENFEKALIYYKEASDYFSLEKSDYYYAQIKMNQGYAYSFAAEASDNVENLIKAKKCLEDAKRIHSGAKKSIHFAKVNLNLSNTYNFLAQNTLNEEFCWEAIKASKNASKVYTPNEFPKLNAMTFVNTGSSYWILSQIENFKLKNAEKKGDLKQGKFHSKKTKEFISEGFKVMEIALDVCKVDNYPLEYGAIMNNMGLLFRELANHQNPEKNFKQAIKYYKKSITIRSWEDYPFDCAQTSINLGNAQKQLSKYTNDEKDIENAMLTYIKALDYYASKDYNNGYGMVSHNLGEAYVVKYSFTSNCADLLEALKLQEESLDIFNKEQYPDHHNTIINEIKNVKNFIIENNCDENTSTK